MLRNRSFFGSQGSIRTSELPLPNVPSGSYSGSFSEEEKVPTSPLTPSGPTRAAAQLMEEVDRLVQSHRSELSECFERWLRTVQHEQHLLLRRPSAASSGLAWCEPTELPPLLSSASMSSASGSRGEKAADLHRRGSPCVVVPSEAAQTNGAHDPMTGSNTQLPFFAGKGKVDTMATEVAGGKKRRSAKRNPMKELLPKRASSSAMTTTPLQRLTASRYYEWFSGMLICVNAVFIGWQTQFMAARAEADAARNLPQQMQSPASFVVLQGIFCFLFTIELGLRWVCDGFLGFFQDSDRWWNILDVGVVLLSIVDLLLHFAIEQQAVLGSISVLRVVRVVRVVRVAKVIRIMKFFRELRMMIFSILGSMKSLLWVILVLAMTFYVFGITFTAACSSALDTTEKWHRPETQNLRDYFGTVDRSILALFMSMSGGNDWAVYYEALQHLPPQYSLLFLLFISFAVFAVVNIVTGVFVESALASNSKDRDIIVHEELEAKKAYLSSMREIFDEMDEDETGAISIEEFESKLDDERVIAYFNALKLDVSDARMLFWLIDYDHSNEVNIDEFLTGCYKLQGESRSLDMKIMQVEVRYLREGFATFMETLSQIQASIDALPNSKSRHRHSAP